MRFRLNVNVSGDDRSVQVGPQRHIRLRRQNMRRHGALVADLSPVEAIRGGGIVQVPQHVARLPLRHLTVRRPASVRVEKIRAGQKELLNAREIHIQDQQSRPLAVKVLALNAGALLKGMRIRNVAHVHARRIGKDHFLDKGPLSVRLLDDLAQPVFVGAERLVDAHGLIVDGLQINILQGVGILHQPVGMDASHGRVHLAAVKGPGVSIIRRTYRHLRPHHQQGIRCRIRGGKAAAAEKFDFADVADLLHAVGAKVALITQRVG